MQIDPAELSVSRRYRLLISLIVPRPIAFVSTRDPGGRHNLAPFSFFMGVASDPPLLAISVSTRSGAVKDTARNILETGEFVVNSATEELAEAVNRAAGDWDPDVDEFALTGLTPVPSVRVAAPRVAEAGYSLECRSHQVIPVGREPHDTRLVIGEVVWFHLRDDLLEPAEPGAKAASGPGGGAPIVDPARLRPIARLGKNLYTKLGERFAMDRPKGSRPDG
ncbi:MAG: flavin reductase family protein [Candidatus Eiseniibacteriota bacterium]